MNRDYLPFSNCTNWRPILTPTMPASMAWEYGAARLKRPANSITFVIYYVLSWLGIERSTWWSWIDWGYRNDFEQFVLHHGKGLFDFFSPCFHAFSFDFDFHKFPYTLCVQGLLFDINECLIHDFKHLEMLHI